MSVDSFRQLAPVVRDVPQQMPTPASRPMGATASLQELLALVAALNEAGHDTGDVLARIDAISTAVDLAIAPDVVSKYLSGDLVNLEPAVVAERVRQAGVDQALYRDMAHMRTAFDSELARSAAAELAATSDAIVAAIRRTFDPSLKAIKAAADVGLLPNTATDALLDAADAETIVIYRNLGPAVQALDRVAQLRVQMAMIANVGPADPQVANFVATVDNLDHLEAAEDIWRGDTEAVQVELPTTGTYIARVPTHRLGGRWLALVAAGYTVRLNTDSQARAVVEAAHAADADAEARVDA